MVEKKPEVPTKSDKRDEELTDEVLDKVSGGVFDKERGGTTTPPTQLPTEKPKT